MTFGLLELSSLSWDELLRLGDRPRLDDRLEFLFRPEFAPVFFDWERRVDDSPLPESVEDESAVESFFF
ncbi:hypothetical protein NBRC116492_05720 [Aurantivibrio infirmus]